MKHLFYIQYTHKEANTCVKCCALSKNEMPVLYVVYSQRRKHLFDMQYTHKE